MKTISHLSALPDISKAANDHLIPDNTLNDKVGISSATINSILLNETSDFIYIKDAQGNILDCNNAFLAILEQPREAILGSEGKKLVDNVFCCLNKIDQEVLASGIKKSGEQKLVINSINHIFIKYRIVPFTDIHGNRCILTRFKDISDKKVTEDRLRILAAAIEYGTATVAVTDMEGKLEYVNQGFVKNTGYKKAEVIGKNPKVLKSGYHSKLYYDNIWNHIRNGENWYGEFCNKAKDGKYYWELANIIPVKNSNNEVTHYVKVSQNITEQKYIEGQIIDSEEKFKSFVSRSTDGIVITDEFGRIRVWNKALESLSAITKKRAIGKYIWDIQYAFLPKERRTPEIMSQLRNSLEQILREGTSTLPNVPFTQNYMRLGKEVYFQTIVFPIKTKRGFCIGSISRDITHEINAKIQLEQSRHFYKQILNSIQDLIYVSDKNGKITYANKAFLSFFNLPEEALNHYLDESFIRTNNSQNPEISTYKNEAEFTGPDDEKYTFLTNTYDIGDLDNNILSYVNVGRNISEIRRTEVFNALQLKLSVELGKISDRDQAFKIIADYLIKLKEIDTCGIYIKDPLENVFNLKAAHGVPESFIQNNKQYGVDDDRYQLINKGELIVSHANELRKLVQVDNFEKLHLKGVALYPIKINEQVVASINFASKKYDNFSDELVKRVILITNQLYNHLLRIEIEEQRKLYVEDLKNIFNSNSDFILIYDYHGNIVEINPSVTRKLGYTIEELRGKPVFSLHPENQIDIAKNLFKQNVIIDKLQQFDFDLDLMSKSGKVFHTNTIVVGGTWEGQKVLIGISRDLTEKLRIQQELQAAKEKAESANIAKSQFLATISHEIKTPINSIKGFSSLVNKNLSHDEQNRTYINAIQESIRTLTSLINDILDFAKIERGKIMIQETIVNVNRFLSSIKQDYQLLFKDKWNVDFVMERGDNLPSYIMMDELRLRQIISNLLNNAIKFTSKGLVKFVFDMVDKRDRKGTIRIVIQDTGKGISKDQQENVFQPFEQEEKLDNKKYKGTGLGLAITKELVELMKGNIALESEVDNGTVFYIDIPNVKIISRAASLPKAPDSTSLYPDLTALVVNNRFNRQHKLIQVLTDAHIITYQVSTNRNAIKMAKRISPDLVFLNAHNHGLSYAKTAEILKHEPLTRHIPILLVDTIEGDRNEHPANGIDEVVNIQHLEASLETLMLKYLSADLDAQSTDDDSVNKEKLQQSLIKLVDSNLLDQFVKAFESPFMKEKDKLIQMMVNQINVGNSTELTELKDRLERCVNSYDIEGVNYILKNIIELIDNERVE